MSILEKLDQSKFECVEYSIEKCSMHVTAAELSHFIDAQDELLKLIRARKEQYKTENGYSVEKANEMLEEACLIPVETMRKTIIGTTKCTRNFLYKLVVGLHMTLDEANKYFELCDGPLTEKCMADYICIKALKDGDSIEKFVEQFEKYAEIKLVKKRRPSL